LSYEQALLLYRKVGYMTGQGDCCLGLGRLAQALGNLNIAGARFREALALYHRVQGAHQIALVHRELARITSGAERGGHIQAARAAWNSIDLLDQIARLDQEFA
jgi:hypothetical protein